MYTAFGEDVDPTVLARGVGGGRGESVGAVCGVCVDVAGVGEGIGHVWRTEGPVDGRRGRYGGGVGLEGRAG